MTMCSTRNVLESLLKIPQPGDGLFNICFVHAIRKDPWLVTRFLGLGVRAAEVVADLAMAGRVAVLTTFGSSRSLI